MKAKLVREYIEQNEKKRAFHRLRQMRDTGDVDNDLGYSREFWKWLDSDEAINIIDILGDEHF